MPSASPREVSSPASKFFSRLGQETSPGSTAEEDVIKPPSILSWAGCAAAFAATLACDPYCEATPEGPGNQDPVSLESCPPLPPGVEPIEGLTVGHVVDRFGGLYLTLSTRPLACGEPAVQHGYCSDDEQLGLSVGFPARQAVVGEHPLGYPLHVEFEAPGTRNVGGGGDIREASVEIFEITDSCVTGRVIGLEDKHGPFDGGFRALRCEP